jgi:hypothetical protein
MKGQTVTESEIKTEFVAAIETAPQSLAAYQEQPLVPSKRGGDRISPHSQAYREASHIAWRWARLLNVESDATSEFDELDAILAGDCRN